MSQHDEPTTNPTAGPTPPVQYVTEDKIVFAGGIWQGELGGSFYELLLKITGVDGIRDAFPSKPTEVTYVVAEGHEPEEVRQQLIELLSPTHIRLCKVGYIFTLTGKVQLYLLPLPDAPFSAEVLEIFGAGVDGVEVLDAGVFLKGDAMVVCQTSSGTGETIQQTAEELAAKLAGLLGYAVTGVRLQDISFFALV